MDIGLGGRRRRFLATTSNNKLLELASTNNRRPLRFVVATASITVNNDPRD